MIKEIKNVKQLRKTIEKKSDFLSDKFLFQVLEFLQFCF